MALLLINKESSLPASSVLNLISISSIILSVNTKDNWCCLAELIMYFRPIYDSVLIVWINVEYIISFDFS